MKNLCVVLVALLVCSGISLALPVNIGEWKADPVQNYDKFTFTLVESTVADSVGLNAFSFFGNAYFNFTGFPSDGYIKYTVEINQSVAPGEEFTYIELSSDSGPTVATKYIEELDEMLTDNGTIIPDSGYTFLTVTDTFYGVVPSASNGFAAAVPEPMTMLLLGLGGLLLRKRK